MRFATISLAIFLALLISVSTSAAPIAKQGGTTFAVADEPIPENIRSMSGYGVNPEHPEWGMNGETLQRGSPAAHGDNISSLALPEGPNPRVVSNALCDEPVEIPDERGLSDYNWLWGQFITHEVDFTTTLNGRTSEGVELATIPIAEDDYDLNPTGAVDLEILFFRSVYLDGTGVDSSREHPNNISAWIDGSVVYGSGDGRANWLRTMEGGRLKVSENYEHGDLLPVAAQDDETAPGMSFGGFSANLKFVAGDARANEHIALLAIHTLFVREHNRLADAIQDRNPDWTDEQVYQRARKIVAAEIAAITFEGYLPSLGITMPDYSSHDPTVQPTIDHEFSVVAFRMGHSQIGDMMFRLDENRQTIPEGNLALRDAFWETSPVTDEGGIAPTLRGLAFNNQPANDLRFSDGLRNQLFGVPGAGGMDLCAIDIQRGRDHAVSDYNTIRESYGLPRVVNWSDITSDVESQNNLSSVYADVDSIDGLMGMLAEDHLEDSALGETMTAIITDQFHRIRAGDPFWYQNDPELASIADEIQSTTLADIILRNTEIESIQCDVFFHEQNPDNFDCNLANAPMSNPQGEDDDDDDDEEFDFDEILIGGIVIIAAVWYYKRRTAA